MSDEHEPIDGASVPAGSTGLPAVDAVLAAVEDLDGRPLEEHVATFESAHEQLRRALDAGSGPS